MSEGVGEGGDGGGYVAGEEAGLALGLQPRHVSE